MTRFDTDPNGHRWGDCAARTALPPSGLSHASLSQGSARLPLSQEVPMPDLYDPNSFDQRLGDAAYRAGEWLKRGAPRALKGRLFHPATLTVAYIAIGLCAFGHVAADNWRADQYEYEQCDRNRQANPATAYNSCDRPDAMLLAIRGLAAGVAWPLYLSWEAQQ